MRTAVPCVVSALGGFTPNLVAVGLSQLVVRPLVVVHGAAHGHRRRGDAGRRPGVRDQPPGPMRRVRRRPVPVGPPAGRSERPVAHPSGSWPCSASRWWPGWAGTCPKAGATRRTTPTCRARPPPLVLLAASAFLPALFAPALKQLMNQFLREERGFSASRISLFSLLTNTPGFIGVVVGARLADRRGRTHRRRPVAVAGRGLTAAMVLAGWPMWAFSVVGAIVGSSPSWPWGSTGPSCSHAPSVPRAGQRPDLGLQGGCPHGGGPAHGRLPVGPVGGGLGKPLLLLSIGRG